MFYIHMFLTYYIFKIHIQYGKPQHSVLQTMLAEAELALYQSSRIAVCVLPKAHIHTLQNRQYHTTHEQGHRLIHAARIPRWPTTQLATYKLHRILQADHALISVAHHDAAPPPVSLMKVSEKGIEWC